MPAGFDGLQNNFSEIIVVGAGLAGTAAAAVLARQGRSVTLIDARLNCPPVFKAEKIEPDQADLLRKLELMDGLLPRAARIREIQACFKGRVCRTTRIEQYGMAYCDMVSGLRSQMPVHARFVLGRVEQIVNSAEMQRVRLTSGQELTCRLVVLACGVSGELPASLGLKRHWVQKNHSVAIAFTMSPENGSAFSFDSMTCYPSSNALGVDFLTLFPIGQTMRANLFAFPRAEDTWVRRFAQQPEEGLRECFPDLSRAIGEYRIAGKVETALIHLYRTQDAARPGVVLIGDAAQSVCPTTGTGLLKVLTDVDVLCEEQVPRWFESGGMSEMKLARFWNDPRKLAVDRRALREAIYRRQARLGESLRWKVHRAKLNFAMQFGQPSRLLAGDDVPQEM